MKHPLNRIAPNTWLISEYKLVNMFLLEGQKQALLIDTGSGVGNLANDVQELTSKPLTVVLTHGHMDHAGGVGQFGDAAIHPADEQLAKTDCGFEIRKNFVASRAPVRNPGRGEFLLSLLQPDAACQFSCLKDGQVFELGDRPVEIIYTPGHTAGSVCLLDHKNRLLFTADMANDCLLMNLPSSTSMVQYRDSIKKLWSRREEFDQIVRGHEEPAVDNASVLLDYIDAAEQLTSGKMTGTYLEQGFRSGYFCRINGIDIWYDPDHLQ